MKRKNLVIALFFSFIHFSILADDFPLSVALTFDSSSIEVNNHYQQVSRMLSTIRYEQHFSFIGGQLSPQISYSLFRGKNGSDVALDVLGFSNIDTFPFSRFQEINLQWQNKRTLFRIGQLDANANFASLKNAGQFINSSFGLTPTAIPLPTYPEMEKGIFIEQKLWRNKKISVGYYRPDEVDASGEQQPLWVVDLCWLCDRDISINTGYWHVKHDKIGSISGAFAYIEGNITEQLHGFSLFSFNNEAQIVAIKKHIKVGFTYDAPFGLEQQQIGIGYSSVFGPDDETIVELFYLFPLNHTISIQPDIQWVNNNIANKVDNVISTLRILVSW